MLKAKWFWCILLFVTAVQALNSLAFAFGTPEGGVPVTDQQALGVFAQLYDAVVNKNWALALGPAVALLVFGLRKFDQDIPKYGPAISKFMDQPAVAFALPTVVSAVGGLGTALAAGQPLGDAAKAVAEASMSAVFTYVGVKKIAEQKNGVSEPPK